jgi:coenzyme F420 hydrogenase subunit beta
MAWKKLKGEVIDQDLCTQCGSCVGLSKGLLEFKEKKGVPLPCKVKEGNLPEECYLSCPARYCNYPELNKFTFGKLPENWLSGVIETSYIGHTKNEFIRRNGASGGVITATLIHLLESNKIQGAICLSLGEKIASKAEPILAKTKEQIIKCAQSVYSVTPTNTILSELDNEEGPFAYVGLPDQVASIRKLQKLGNKNALKIKYVLGIYMGTQMYFEAIRSFLRSNGVKSEQEITSLKYRAGEWPGYLQIKLKNGRTLKAEKFYYNYLIPFFITSSSLQLVDFTNELTDLSVGDAWSPKYEEMKGGHSVILVRSKQGEELIQEMASLNILNLEKVSLDKALDMHGHMLDFKKRGSFIRNSWKNSVPEYGYEPLDIPFSRRAIEYCLHLMFVSARNKYVRKVMEKIPLKILGPTFNKFRKVWKDMSKPTKRKGLKDIKFKIQSDTNHK